MSSNSALLSNSMSPLINSVEIKANYEPFRYKLLAGVGAASKQKREIQFQPAYGATNSINLLKYGLCQSIYLRMVVRSGAGDNTGTKQSFNIGGLISAIDEITLSSHSKILERLDRVAIMKYILDKTQSSNDRILSLTGYNGTATMDFDKDSVFYIPLPFSFFGSMDKAKDLLHLQQLTVNISWASLANSLRLMDNGVKDHANGWVYQPCQLVINYLELPSAKLNQLWNENYSTNKPTNQLLLTTFKETEKAVTLGANKTDYAFDLTTKGCVVKSYICIRDNRVNHGRADFVAINNITFKCNGQNFYKADADEYEFVRCLEGEQYNALSVNNAVGRYHAIYEVNHSIVPNMPSHKKYSQAISFKNLSAPQYVLNMDQTTANNTTDVIVEIIHVQLNLVAFSKQDGSCESILSI